MIEQELSEAQKRAVAFITRPKPHFAPKSAEQLAAEEKAAIANMEAGEMMPDGTIFAGISPDNKQPMYVTAKDASICLDFDKAAAYAKDLDVHGHQDWHVPTKEELNVLFQNREKGALKETFNLTGSGHSGLYWSSTPDIIGEAYCQKFNDGGQCYGVRDFARSVRCVRYGGG